MFLEWQASWRYGILDALAVYCRFESLPPYWRMFKFYMYTITRLSSFGITNDKYFHTTCFHLTALKCMISMGPSAITFISTHILVYNGREKVLWLWKQLTTRFWQINMFWASMNTKSSFWYAVWVASTWTEFIHILYKSVICHMLVHIFPYLDLVCHMVDLLLKKYIPQCNTFCISVFISWSHDSSVVIAVTHKLDR